MSDKTGPKSSPAEEASHLHEKYSVESRLIYGKNVSRRWDFSRHVIPPMSASTNFRFRSVEEGAAAFRAYAERTAGQEVSEFLYIYDRLDEPNKDLLEEHLAIADGGDIALVFSTGMAAISTLLSVLIAEQDDGSRDELLVHMPVYGCTNDLLRKHFEARLHYPVRYTDLSDPDRLPGLLTEQTRVVYCESPANPTMTLVDIVALAKTLAEENKRRSRPVLLVVDNTFASPFCQRPLALGADFVCYSLTKSISGFGVVTGGSIASRRSQAEAMGAVLQLRKDMGGTLSSSSAWHILVYGVSTLTLRMRKMQANAAAAAEFLDACPDVGRVAYPGLPGFEQHELAKRQMVDYSGKFAPGNMLYFEPRASDPDRRRELAALWSDRIAREAYTMTLAVSLGQIRTLVDYPGGMTHAVVGEEDKALGHIDPGGMRMSVGIEETGDLLKDLEKVLRP